MCTHLAFKELDKRVRDFTIALISFYGIQIFMSAISGHDSYLLYHI